MKQKLDLTQLSKSQMEDVLGGGGNPDQPVMCSGCAELGTYMVLDIGQNCDCGSIFTFLGLNL